MSQDKLEKLLNQLSSAAKEPVDPGLANDIKQHIPRPLLAHRRGLETINVIIDLRINRLTAAAAIIITMILLANLMSPRNQADRSIYRDSKLLAKHLLAGANTDRTNLVAGKLRYEYLMSVGKDVVYYGDSIDPADSNAVLMHWKLSDGTYRVIFADLRADTVTTEQLVNLQALMLSTKTK